MVKIKRKNDNATELDLYISKYGSNNVIKFNDYLTSSVRKYYLASNIKEFYVINGEIMILKSYIKIFNHTSDNPSIDKITDKLTKKSLDDRGKQRYIN